MFSPKSFKAIVSGRSRGCIPGALRGLFRLISVPWSIIVAIRNILYDTGFLRSHSVGIPVISVGNLTLGGTGKTPVVAWLAKFLLSQGFCPGIISRGYKASNVSDSDIHPNNLSKEDIQQDRYASFRRYNDEARELDLLLESRVPQFLCPDRVKAARALRVFEPECNVLVLDDAFQHRRIDRMIDIVLLDALDPFGGGRIFPRGFLRENLNALRRANVVLVSRADLIDEATTQMIKERVLRIAPHVLFGRITHRPVLVHSSQGESQTFESWRLNCKESDQFYAFCGIGNPDGFFQGLAREKICVAGQRQLPDHCQYTQELLDEIVSEARQYRATGILTTLKDYVKIKSLVPQTAVFQAVEIGIEFEEGERELVEYLISVLSVTDVK